MKAVLKYATGEKVSIDYKQPRPGAFITWKGEDLEPREGKQPGNFVFVWFGKGDGDEEVLMYKQLTAEDCKDGAKN